MTLRNSGFLGHLATHLLTDSSLTASVEQLDEQTRTAADADRQMRAANLAALLGDDGMPLVMITRVLASAPHVSKWTTGLDASQVASDLRAGRSVAEVALRHGLASIETKAGDSRPGHPVEMVTKALRVELSLPQGPAERVAAHFVGAHLLLHFATTAEKHFSAATLSESAQKFAGDEGPVTQFLTTFWT